MDYALGFSLLYFHETSPYVPVSAKSGGTGLSPPLLLWDQSLARCAGPDCKLSPRRRKQREGEGQRDEVVLLLEGPQGPPRGKRLTWKH